MEITTTIGCLIGCDYCPQKEFIASYRQRSDVFSMSFDVFKTCVDKVPRDQAIHFSGMAEPWLNAECTRMVDYAHGRGYRIKVFTTLVGVGASDIAVLERLHEVSFKIHLPSQEGLEKIEVDDRYLGTLDSFLQSASRARWSLRLHVHGRHLHPLVRRLLHGRMKYDRLAPTSRAGHLARPFSARKKGVLRCERSRVSNVLLPNGDVLLCCCDYGAQYVLGNLLQCDYRALYETKVFRRVSEGLEESSSAILCRYCEYACNADLVAALYNPVIGSLGRLAHLRNHRE